MRVHYTGTLEDGTVFGSSQGRDAIEFTIGQGQAIAPIENALVGMNPGDHRTTRLAAAEAFGERRDDLIMTFPRGEMPPDIEPQVGQRLQLRASEESTPVLATVTAVSETGVTIDANHPLAGHELIFDVQLVEIL